MIADRDAAVGRLGTLFPLAFATLDVPETPQSPTVEPAAAAAPRLCSTLVVSGRQR